MRPKQLGRQSFTSVDICARRARYRRMGRYNEALGVKSAVLTAKHGCGFAIWLTTALLPDGSPYKYHASVDVIQSFVSSMEKRGIGHGFYYSLTNNFYLNVIGMKAGHYNPPIEGQQRRNVNFKQLHFISLPSCGRNSGISLKSGLTAGTIRKCNRH